MKKFKIFKSTMRGKIFKKLDSLMFQSLTKERGHICEIHKRKCPQIGQMHILSKRAHPRLRYCRENILLAGWFCSHYWTHQDTTDERAIYAFERIKQLLGDNYRERLLIIEMGQPKQTITYLKGLLIDFRKEST